MPDDCFCCRKPAGDAAAYITKFLRPVCGECLNILCEKYVWSEDSLNVRRANRKAQLSPRTKDEIAHELWPHISSLPVFSETELKVDSPSLTRLMRSPELKNIFPLREF